MINSSLSTVCCQCHHLQDGKIGQNWCITAKYAKKVLRIDIQSMSTSGPIQEKNHFHASGVASAFVRRPTLQNTRKHIHLEWSLINCSQNILCLWINKTQRWACKNYALVSLVFNQQKRKVLIWQKLHCVTRGSFNLSMPAGLALKLQGLIFQTISKLAVAISQFSWAV